MKLHRRPSAEREGQQSSHSDCRPCERFWTGSSPHRERGQQTAGPMEPPSGPASRRHVPWNRLLLAVTLLSFWPPPTTARLTVDTVPPLAAEGSIVVFNVLGKEGLVLGYGWFRGNRVDRAAAIDVYQVLNNSFTPGPANTGRETIKPNGSLIIQSVQKRDSGTYTVVTVKADLTNVSASGDLQVYSLLQQPSIQVSDPMDRDKENKVVITCNTNETDISIKWIFNGQYIKAAKNIFLSEDGKKLTIDPIKKENAGKYQCEIFNIGTSNRSGIFELKVKKSSLFDLTTGTVVGILVVTSVCLGLIAALVYFLFFK